MHNSPYTLPNSENNKQSLSLKPSSLTTNPAINLEDSCPSTPVTTPIPEYPSTTTNFPSVSQPNQPLSSYPDHQYPASLQSPAIYQTDPQSNPPSLPTQTPLNLAVPFQNSAFSNPDPIVPNAASISQFYAAQATPQLENREVALLDNLFVESFPPAKSIAALSRKICSYTEILRGYRWRWFRPIFTVLLGLIFLILLSIGFGFLAALVFITTKENKNLDLFIELLTSEDTADPLSLFLLLGSVAILIPCAAWASKLAMKQKLGYISSVAGHLRWSWLLTSLSVLIPIYAILIIFLAPLLENGYIVLSPRPDLWLSILVLIFICPLQTAAEEYLFRGLLMQIIGSYFKSYKLAWIIPSLISIPLFVAAHGASNPWVNLDLAIFALGATYLVWLTGGLEASIVMHFCNNFCAFISDILSGGTQSSSPRQADQLEFGAVSILLPLVLQLIVIFIITVLYRHKQKSASKALSSKHSQMFKPAFGNLFFPPTVDDVTWRFYQNSCYQRQLLNWHLSQTYISQNYPVYQPYR